MPIDVKAPGHPSLCRNHPSVRVLPDVQDVRTVEEFAALYGEWQELGEDCSVDSPFAYWEWAFSWWKHFGENAPVTGPPRTLRLLCVRDGHGRLSGIAPFYGSGEGGTGISPRELRMLGDDGRAGEGMTDEPILLLRRGCEQETLSAVLTHLLAGKRRRPDFFKLRLQSPEPLLPHSPALVSRGFRAKLRNRWETVRGDRSEMQWLPGNWLLRTKRQQGAEAAALPSSWAAFRQSLSRSMRDNLSYYPRRLEKDGHTLCVRLARTPQEVRSATPALVALHNHRAQSARGPRHGSHIPTERHGCFLADCLPRMAARGQAFIGLVEINGEVVAAQAFLEAAFTLTVYYSGFRSEWHDYSPLTILHAEVIQDAIRRGLQRINFLPGQTLWKQRWRASAVGVIEEMTALHTSPGALARMSLPSAQRALFR